MITFRATVVTRRPGELTGGAMAVIGFERSLKVGRDTDESAKAVAAGAILIGPDGIWDVFRS